MISKEVLKARRKKRYEKRKERGGEPQRESLPLGRSHTTRSGNKKERRRHEG